MLQLLKQSVTITRPTSTNGDNFGVEEANATVYTKAASVQSASSSVMIFYAQRQMKITHTIYVAGTLDLQRGDRASDGSNEYQIIGWRDLSGRGQVTAIDAELYT